MSDSRHQYHPHPSSHRAADGEHNRRVSGSIEVSGGIEANLPSELIEEYKATNTKTDTREDKRDRREHSRYVVETITLGFVVLVAFLNIAQLYFTRTQFIAEERPYLLVSSTGTLGNHDPLTTIAVAQANYGKSPAVDVMGMGTIFYGANAMSKVDAWFAKHDDEVWQRKPHQSISVIPPNAPSDPAKPPILVNVVPEYQPSAEDRIDAAQRDYGMVIVTIVRYKDTAGNRYQTDLCMGHMRDGTMNYCPTHNRIK